MGTDSFRFSTCDVNLNFNLSSPINQTQKLITLHHNFTMGSAEDRPAPLRLGTVAPDFEAETTAGPIKFHDFIGDKWVVLFSHPEDYTPVCTTELGAFAKLEPEFTKRNVKLIGLSANTVKSPEAEKLFPKMQVVKPYLRFTPLPKEDTSAAV